MSLYSVGNDEFGALALQNMVNITEIFKLTEHSKYSIKNVNCGFNYNIYIDGNNDYWSAGHNTYGQCSIGNFDKSIQSLTKINYFKQNNIKISKLCTSISGRCTFWISDDNKFYGNGLNIFNQLGLNNDDDNKCKPVLINDLKHIVDATSAWYYSIALYSFNIIYIISYMLRTDEIKMIPNDIIYSIKVFYGETDKVFSTSYSEYGGNGHGKTDTVWKNKGKWIQIERLKHKKIIKIQTGLQHSLFLQSNGTVWCCGYNLFGQLGLGHTKNINIPTVITYFIENNIKIKDISCGFLHNLAIDYNDQIYSWGINEFGQCGINNATKKNIYTPTIIHSFKHFKIKTIKCGKWHSYVCTFDGKHFLFGSNQYNECIKSNEEFVVSPFLINTEIEENFKGKIIENVYLGHQNTILCLNDDR